MIGSGAVEREEAAEAERARRSGPAGVSAGQRGCITPAASRSSYCPPNDSVRRAGRVSDWCVCAGRNVCGGESACTPDSVPTVPENRRWRPSLSAGGCPPAPAADPGVSADGPSSPCVALLPMGFAEPPGSPRALVRSYRTVSPLPVRGRSGDRSRHRRSVLCGTFLRVAPTGCYPAPCPVESGRSSDRCAEAPGTRPPGRLATNPIVALRQSYSHRNRQVASVAVTPDTRRASRGRWR